MLQIEEESDLIDPESMAKIKHKLDEIYKGLGNDSTSNPSLLGVIREIELSLETLLKKREYMGAEVVKDKERNQDRERRQANIGNKTAEDTAKNEEIKKKMADRQNRPIIKNRKKVMERSAPKVKKIKVKKIEPDQDILDRIEFLEESLNPYTGAKT